MENGTLEGMVNVSECNNLQLKHKESHYVQNNSKCLPVCVLQPLMTTEIIINNEYLECN